MGQDVSLEIADEIASAKVFGSSDNIRHGRYRFLIKRIFAELVETDSGKNKFAFWEFRVLKSEPNPQTEGDRDASGKLIDDGTKPNAVGSDCAMKVNFDGPGGRSAGSNIKRGIQGLFNKSEISEEEMKKTWVDLARQKSVKKGEICGFNAQTNQPIYATEDKIANPACGMVIDCYTRPKKKKKANDKGAYITMLIFTCAAPIGEGENAPELVAKRRAEVEATMLGDDDDDDVTPSPQAPSPMAVPSAPVPQAYAPPAPQAVAPLPPAPPAPPAPPPPVVAPFVPPAPWVAHPSMPPGPTPETRWFWSNPSFPGGDNSVRSEAQLRAGR